MRRLHLGGPGAWLAAGLIFGGLYLIGLFSYPLFHGLAEAFTIAVGCGIFMVAWNARGFAEDHLLLWLGVASLFVGGLDLLHMLTYAGIGLFPGEAPNLPTQLWLAARYLQAAALVVAPIYLTRRLDARLAFAAWGGTAALLLLAILVWRIFPDAFVEPGGLTLFKEVSDAAIILTLVAAIGRLNRKRHLLHPDVFRLFVASIVLLAAGEAAFTASVHGDAASNLIGHLLKILAFYFLYKATVETALLKPYALLFRTLKQSEEELRKALGEVKQLSGMLPICSACKQIRNDQGYWQEVEVYLTEHSEAQFSHGLCPGCAHRLYPEYFPAPPRRG
ncbi:MAG: MASE3 domain-containing protein [Candidatus Methylomirabilales bacterium]